MDHRRRRTKDVLLVLFIHYETKFGENLFLRFHLDDSVTPLTKKMDWIENNYWKAVLPIKCSNIRYRYYMEDSSKTNFHWEKDSASRTIEFDLNNSMDENTFEIVLDVWGEPTMSKKPTINLENIAPLRPQNIAGTILNPEEVVKEKTQLQLEMDKVKQTNSNLDQEIKCLKEELEQSKRKIVQMESFLANLQGINLQALSFSELKTLQQNNKESSERIMKSIMTILEEQMDNRQCIICCENTMDTACVPCGHLCMCSMCALSIGKNGHCPTCRTKIAHLQKLFL